MMTTTASKAGLKAAASRRTAKHAQTTPLPPRGGDVELALEAVVEAAAAKATAPRKRVAKKAAPAPAPAQDDQPVVVEPRKRGKGHAIPAQPEPAPEPVAVPEGDTKAHRNVQAFYDNGWTVTVQVDGDYAELIAQRGAETIHQAWAAGVYHNDSATYTIADRTVRTRNVAEAKRWAARTPEAAHAELAKVGANKAFVKKAPETLVRYSLPFDPYTVTEGQLWTALTGKGIRWHNRLSNSEESAIVGGNPRWFSVVEYAGSRIVQFVCQAQGFRAFKLENLLLVGRPSRKNRADGGPVDIADVDLVDEAEVSLSVDPE